LVGHPLDQRGEHARRAAAAKSTQSGRPTLRRHLDAEANVDARGLQHGGQRASGRGRGLGPSIRSAATRLRGIAGTVDGTSDGFGVDVYVHEVGGP